MKKITSILIWLVLLCQPLYAQQSEALNYFRTRILPAHASYFSQAELNSSGTLELTATNTYCALTEDQKKPVLAAVSASWNDYIVQVRCGSRVEIWRKSETASSLSLLDVLDSRARVQPLKDPAYFGRPNPFFIYFGGQVGGDTQDNYNMAFNLRTGFFLLMQRWDLALSFTSGRTGNTEYELYGYMNLGLMSKVYFPIKRVKLSPNIGGFVGISSFGEGDAGLTGYGSVGLSWFMGFGSLNVDVNIGKQVMGNFGITIFPSAKKLL